MISDNISEYVTKEKNINFPPDETPVQMQSTSTVQHNDAYYHHVDVPDITQVFILGLQLLFCSLLCWLSSLLRFLLVQKKETIFRRRKYMNISRPGRVFRPVIYFLCVCWRRYSVLQKSWQKCRDRSSWRMRRKLPGRPGAVVLMVIRAKILPGRFHRCLLPISMISSIKRPVFLLTVVCFMNRIQFWIIVNGYAFLFRSSFRMGVTGLKYCA